MPADQSENRLSPGAADSILAIPVENAEIQFNERIAAGQALQQSEPASADEFQRLLRRIARWREVNQRWLDTILSGEAAAEYRRIVESGETFDVIAGTTYLGRCPDLYDDISALQSIKYRLSTWASKPDVVPSDFAARASQEGPIFIVHGSDDLRAASVALAVSNATGRRTIILRDEPSLGRTLIEKFEQHAAEVSYAIIVLTADDQGGRADGPETMPRARQNVIFEMGYFYGLLGRDRVSALIRPGVEQPSDIGGIAYITFDDGRAWRAELLRELEHAGFGVTL